MSFLSECCGAAMTGEMIDVGLCPACKEHCEVYDEDEDLEEIEPTNWTECSYKDCNLNGEYGCRHYYTQIRVDNCKLRIKQYDMTPLEELMNYATKCLQSDLIIRLNHKSPKCCEI